MPPPLGELAVAFLVPKITLRSLILTPGEGLCWHRISQGYGAVCGERRRPPPHIRAELDLAFRMQGQSVEIFEVRPRWENKSTVLEHPVAKATFSKIKGNWRVFWRRADLKLHSYKPAAQVASIVDFLALVERDDHGCFFG